MSSMIPILEHKAKMKEKGTKKPTSKFREGNDKPPNKDL